MPLNNAYIALAPLAAKLEELGVAYYIGGSVASSIYTFPRSTMDIDIVADLQPKHVADLVESLSNEYYVSGAMIHEAISRRSCCNLIHNATAYKVDIFVVKGRPYDRVALERARAKYVDPEYPALRFFFAAPEDITLAKLEWYRLGDEISDRQWQDIVGILKSTRSLDRQYMEHWATELGVADLLAGAWKEVEA
jgi:hypothetical protein